MGFLLFASVMASTLSARLGMPILLLFLLVGILAGEQGILGFKFDNVFIANMIGQVSLAVILLDGGLRTSTDSFRVALKPAIVLATWGVVATVLLLSLCVKFVLGLDWYLCLLMASIVGSTDAGAVFALLRNSGVKLNSRVQSTLEIESGANDPMAIFLVTVFVGLSLAPDKSDVLDTLLLFVRQFGGGLLMGLLVGYLLSRLLEKLHLAEGLYALLILSGGLMLFSVTNLLQGSGFLAVFIAGIVVGNRRTRATEHVLRVMDGLAWLAQAVLFLVLGLLLLPQRILEVGGYTLLIACFLMLVARPLAVLSSIWFFRYKINELAFISWVGLRGSVPVTLAIIPMVMGVNNSVLLFDLAFGVVILSLLVQGSTLPIVARWCKVVVPTRTEPKDKREIWVGDKATVDILKFEVEKGSFAVGRHPEVIAEHFGDDVRLFALVHEGKQATITSSSTLRSGDVVWFTTNSMADESIGKELAKVFINTQREHKIKSEFFGEWMVPPSAKVLDLAAANGITFPSAESAMTVNDYIIDQLEHWPVRGDSVEFGEDLRLTVREIDDKDGSIKEIGLKLVPKTEEKSKTKSKETKLENKTEISSNNETEIVQNDEQNSSTEASTENKESLQQTGEHKNMGLDQTSEGKS